MEISCNMPTEDNVIDGLKYSQNINQQLKQYIDFLQQQYGFIPHIAIVIVGNNLASEIYVKNKIQLANKLGVLTTLLRFDGNVSEKELINQVQMLNKNKNIHGIIVQLPLPQHINQQNVLFSISPEKDIDGLTPLNVGLLQASKEVPYSIVDVLHFINSRPNNKNTIVDNEFVANKIKNIGHTIPLIPCTPLGCYFLIKQTLQTKKEEIVGKNAVILGNSNLVSKPMARLLLQSGATVTILHSKSQNTQYFLQNADIIVSATGKSQTICDVKTNAVLIDIGIHKDPSTNKITGDLDYQTLAQNNKITPVPKGVGPMTVTSLMINGVIAGLKHLLV